MIESGRQSGDLGHGPRLSQHEYEKCIVKLHSGLPPSPSKQQEIDILRREFDLSIDFRLGKNFPKERRDALWQAQKQVEKKRFWLLFYWLTHFISYRWIYARANRLAGYLFDEYKKVLTKEELRAYFDLDENERPTLPIDKRYL